MKRVPTIIIGAGLTGLSAAYHLREGYVLIERGDRVGGVCRSATLEGFTFDHAIHILYTRDPYAASLITQTLLKGDYHSQQRESWIYLNGIYTEFPFQANTFGHPPEVIAECVLGLIQATYQNGPCPPPVNFRNWICRTFGDGIAKHFMIPYNKKVWAMDPSLMDFSWIAERVPQPDIRSVLLGALQPAQRKIGFNNDFWYPKTGGIETLSRGFLPYVKNLKLRSTVSRINTKERTLVVRTPEEKEYTLGYSKVVSTMPLPAVVSLLDEASESVRAAAAQLQGNTVYAVNIGIEGEIEPKCRQDLPVKPGKFHWVYFPSEDFVLHRLSFPKNFSPNMCPEGMSSIQVEVSSSPHRPVNKETIIEVVVAELRRAGIIRPCTRIVLKHMLTLTPAYVIYDLRHRENVDLIRAFLQERNIYSCGRFGQWEYLNMDHSILSGKKAAEWVRTG